MNAADAFRGKKGMNDFYEKKIQMRGTASDPIRPVFFGLRQGEGGGFGGGNAVCQLSG